MLPYRSGMIDAQMEKTDISEHLPTLRLLCSLCSDVVEFGVRSGVSTRAIISSGTPSVHYDVEPPPFDFPYPHKFVQASTLDIEIEPTDFLFIDSDHTYEQLSKELKLHGSKVRKYIAFHDTTIFADALIPAIAEFMTENKEWYNLAQYVNNNGFLVISRIPVFRGEHLPIIHVKGK